MDVRFAPVLGRTIARYRTHYRAAITAQVVLLAYFELCILIPLGRWNDQPGMGVLSSGNIIMGAAIGGAQL